MSGIVDVIAGMDLMRGCDPVGSVSSVEALMLDEGYLPPFTSWREAADLAYERYGRPTGVPSEAAAFLEGMAVASRIWWEE